MKRGIEFLLLLLSSYIYCVDSCILDVSQELGQDVMKLEKRIKEAFGAKWKEELCEGKHIEEKIEAGSPAVLVVAPSALRAIELLRFVSLGFLVTLFSFVYENEKKKER